MNKIRTMVAAVAVVSAISGTLAFKASNAFGTKDYCTRRANLANGSCEGYVTGSRVATPGISFKAFETSNVDDCTNQTCNQVITITSSQP